MKPKVRFIPKKIHLKKGDMAAILSGDDKGKIGEVLKVYPKLGKIVVEGVNVKVKHIKPTQEGKGRIVNMPYPIYSSNAMFYSEEKKGTTRLGRRRLENGKSARYMKRFKETI